VSVSVKLSSVTSFCTRFNTTYVRV